MKRYDQPDRIVLDPDTGARATVIWLHGLGAHGSDFVSLVPALRLPPRLGIRFVFPHAPLRPVTLNGGASMPAWYDIISLDRRAQQDLVGINQSRSRIEQLVTAEVAAGIPSKHVLLAGFSQGGAMALYTGIRSNQPLAGVLAMSTYLLQENKISAEGSQANRQLPILMQHGIYDAVVEHELGKSSRDRLLALGYGVGWDEYPMQHEICEEQIPAISGFLQERLS